MGEVNTDFNQLDYNQLIFRAIDRIQIVAQSTFKTQPEKLFAFSWSVRLFNSLITKKLKDEEFNNIVKKIISERKTINELKLSKSSKYSFEADFENLMVLFEACMDLFGRRGHLYKHVVKGKQR